MNKKIYGEAIAKKYEIADFKERKIILKTISEIEESKYKARAGSQRQLQILANEISNNILFGKLINNYFKNDLKVISPIVGENFKELSGEEIKNIINPKLNWSTFWPKACQMIDGFLTNKDGEAYIIEAKSHPDESLISCKAKSIKSRELIKKSLKKYVGLDSYIDSTYYQLANRLALVNFMNSSGQNTNLIYICFANDLTHYERHKEWITDLATWEQVIKDIKIVNKKMLGIEKIIWIIIDLKTGVIKIYKDKDVKELHI